MSAFTFTAQRGLSLLGDEKGVWMADTTAETLVGAELVTNGGFDTDLSGWTDSSTGTGSIAWNAGGYLDLTSVDGSNVGNTSQSFSTIIGKTYQYTYDHVDADQQRFYIGTSLGSNNIVSLLNTPSGVTTGYFVATTTVTHVTILGPTSGAGTSSADDISIRLADPDLSTNANGGGIFGSLIKSAVATGADLMGWSNYSASNYWEQPYNSDFDPGTGALRIRFWLSESANSATETVYERDSSVSAQRVTVEINASGNLVFTCDDGTTARASTSSIVVDDSIRRYFECVYSAGTLSIYINGALDSTATGTALLTLTNIAAVIRWGLSVADTNPLTNGNLCLTGGSVAAPTAAQIKARYDKEKHLFKKYSYYTQESIEYSLDIPLASNPHSSRTYGAINTSLDRTQTEHIVDGDDNDHELTTTILHRTDNTELRISEFREFIYATRTSETFTVDFNGTVASEDEPITVIRVGDRVRENRAGKDMITSGFTVREQ